MKYIQECQQVCKAAQEISKARLVPGTWGNVSMKIPGEKLLVITPSGMDYTSLTAEDMIVVDWDREIVQGRFKPSSELPFHLAVYKNRMDIQAVIHVHSTYATAYAVAGKAIPVITEEMAQVIGHEVEVASYAHCGTDQLAENILKVLENDKRAVLMANHGLVGLGEDMSSAMRVCTIAERTAMIALFARLLGPVKQLSDEDIKFLSDSFKGYGQEK